MLYKEIYPKNTIDKSKWNSKKMVKEPTGRQEKGHSGGKWEALRRAGGGGEGGWVKEWRYLHLYLTVIPELN